MLTPRWRVSRDAGGYFGPLLHRSRLRSWWRATFPSCCRRRSRWPGAVEAGMEG